MIDKYSEAVENFKSGKIVIFPTDTAIGIGCRIDDGAAVRKLFDIRRRPENKPVLILVDSVEMAKRYLLPIPKKVKEKIIERYWPGKLTIILRCKADKVPSIVRGGGNTLGVRFPNNEYLRNLIKDVGVPIVAPSANFHGEKTPFNLADVSPELVKLADYVLDVNFDINNEVSTVIDCAEEPWRVIREGAVKICIR